VTSSLLHCTSTTQIYTLSLHDALPISLQKYFSISQHCRITVFAELTSNPTGNSFINVGWHRRSASAGFAMASPMLLLITLLPWRSEEHTSELQSRENLVCRLLLEKKNR